MMMMMKVTNIYKHEIVDTRASYILDPASKNFRIEEYV